MTKTPQELEYISAHTHASKHRVELEASARCGCFFCFRTFTTVQITTWVDQNQTALCPFCGIDSVLGNAHCQIGDRFLRRMHTHHFATRAR